MTQLLLSREELLAGPPADVSNDEWTVVSGVVNAPRGRLTLDIESGKGGRRLDVWVGDRIVAWHAAGDDATTRRVITHPVPLLPSTIAMFTGLGERATGDAALSIASSTLTDALHSSAPSPIGRVVRAWSLAWDVRGADGGLSVVDGGEGQPIYAVAGERDGLIDLRQVSPVDVWLQVSDLQALLVNG